MGQDAELRGDDDLVAPTLQRLTDDLFAVERAVALSGVDVGDTQVERAMDGADRRARVTPADAGLPPQGTRRRVKGLRREEVALLAGVSPEYYARLERGQATGPSVGVVDAVADVTMTNAPTLTGCSPP